MCDLFKLLEWSDEVCAYFESLQTNDMPASASALWSEGNRRAVLGATMDLLSGFQEAERCHRYFYTIWKPCLWRLKKLALASFVGLTRYRPLTWTFVCSLSIGRLDPVHRSRRSYNRNA
jgi:hypothetical protein